MDYKQIENIHFNTNYSLWTFDHNIKVLIRWSHDGVLLNENGFREVFFFNKISSIKALMRSF